MDCRYCNRSLVNPGSLAIHEKACPNNPDRVKRKRSPLAGRQTGRSYHVWNRGLTGVQTAWNKGIPNSTTGVGSTPEIELHRRQKIAEKAKLNNGGLRKGSGRGKKGYYKGYWCDSSWELAFVLYNIDHDIEFERNTIGFDYSYNCQNRKYFPDFIINNEYFEIKGFITEQTKIKMESFPHKLNIVDKQGIKKYIDYAVLKYGKNFIDLYGE